MKIQWILNSKIPKPGFVVEFRKLEKQFIDNCFSTKSPEEKAANELTLLGAMKEISNTPLDFDACFRKKDQTVDAQRVNESHILPPTLRGRATVEQTAIEAIDYGMKIHAAVRTQQVKRPNDISFEIEREINHLRNTATWLIQWGKRGFGYIIY